ncbi:o-succinylbenzoate synthase [Halobacteria archaeon AArc-dxtr1]|nr:o-succinylbenzoate synthase [Halobacteria archaeon AArc-dxtr1]
MTETYDPDHERDLNLAYREFSLELSDPLETAAGKIDRREGFLVRIDDGETVGYGEAAPLPGWTEPLADCERALERATTAIDEGAFAAVEAVDDIPATRHAVTLALADLRSTRASTPLYRHLGAESMVARVPANATLGDGGPDETVAAAKRAVERGFRCCKLKVGQRAVEADVERIRRVREAVGPEIELRADANGAWSDEQARQAVSGFAEHDLALLEQPLPADELEGHAALRDQGVDIALDEGVHEHGVDAIIGSGAADALVLKPMALGGVDRARDIAIWTSQLGVKTIVTTTIDAVAARTGAVHLAAAIPDVPACGLATGDRLATDLARDPVLFENGAAVVPQAKGLGVSDLWEE